MCALRMSTRSGGSPKRGAWYGKGVQDAWPSASATPIADAHTNAAINVTLRTPSFFDGERSAAQRVETRTLERETDYANDHVEHQLGTVGEYGIRRRGLVGQGEEVHQGLHGDIVIGSRSSRRRNGHADRTKNHDGPGVEEVYLERCRHAEHLERHVCGQQVQQPDGDRRKNHHPPTADVKEAEKPLIEGHHGRSRAFRPESARRRIL